jgi:chromosome partitioning protein
MIISIWNQKGGVGKTTIAINLAYAFKKSMAKILLIDADESENALDWHEAGKAEVMEVLGICRPTLQKDTMRLRRHYDFIIIDCHGAVGEIKDVTMSALLSSDMVLVPVQPSQLDIWSSHRSVEILKTQQRLNKNKPKAAFIINEKKPNTILGRGIFDTLKEIDFPLLNSCLSQREIYKTTITDGRTVFHGDTKNFRIAAQEINSLLDELKEFMR